MIQLHPDVSKTVRRVVVIRDLRNAAESLILVIEADVDVIVGPLLPIGWTRSPRSGALRIRRRKPTLDLKETIGGITVFGVG